MLEKYLKEKYKKDPNFYKVVIEDDGIFYYDKNTNPIISFGTCIAELERENTDISCGVLQVYEINDFYYEIKQYFEEKYLSTIFKQYLNNIKKRNDTAFLIMSTTKKDKELVKILDEICSVKSFYRKNPNSGNFIKIWIF